MPLTDNGLTMPEHSNVLASQKQKLKEIYGDDIDTSPGSVFGKLAMYNAENVEETNDKEQQTYDGANIMTATGVQLDRLAANAGIQRNSAQEALAKLDITGSPGYIVVEGTEFETKDADIFSTTSDVQLADSGKKDNDGNEIGTGSVMAVSEEAAEYENVAPNTITMQFEPVDDITSVNNPKPAFGGADLETDYDLRQRIIQNNKARPGPTANGLRTALLNVPGVFNVHMQNNISPYPDKYGNPGHSIHFYVSGGRKDDIFDALMKNAAYGTTFDGNISEDDQFGNSTEHLAYDEALPANLYFKINLIADSGYDEDAVKQSVDDYLSDFDMGSKIVINKLFSYLYEIDGVDEVTGIQISTDGKNWTSNDIQLARYQIARIQDDDKDIQINATNNMNGSGDLNG